MWFHILPKFIKDYSNLNTFNRSLDMRVFSQTDNIFIGSVILKAFPSCIASIVLFLIHHDVSFMIEADASKITNG